MRQIKRERPTLKTAHEFHQTGSHLTSSPKFMVANADRQRHVDEAAEALARLIKEQFPRSANLEYAILKAHLIIEYAITEYIRCLADVLVEPKRIDFNFKSKLEVAYLMGLGVNDPLLLPSIERLNQIRNQVAHSFVVDRALVDELIRINSEDYADFNVANDRERVVRLRALCSFIAGHISARMTVKVLYQTKFFDEKPDDTPS